VLVAGREEPAKARWGEEDAKQREVGVDVFEFRRRGESRVDAGPEDLAHRVIGAALEMHRILGPGRPENAYKLALSRELTLRGIEHRCEVPVIIEYKGEVVGEGRVDVLGSV